MRPATWSHVLMPWCAGTPRALAEVTAPLHPSS
jgi:hypothetical protein